MSSHKDAKLLNNALQSAQPVVLSQSGEEVLDDALSVLGAEVLAQLGDNRLLIRLAQAGRRKDSREPGILLEDVGERLQRLGRRVELVGLRGGGIL